MTRSFSILFISFMIFAAGGFWLHTIRADSEAAFLEEVATQAELNKNYLKKLHKELDQLQWQLERRRKNLVVYYEYFDMCTKWEQPTLGPALAQPRACASSKTALER